MQYTQEDLKIIRAAQDLVKMKGGHLTVWDDDVTISSENFVATFNPEDCSERTYKSGDRKMYAMTTITGGMQIQATLDQEEYDAWWKEWDDYHTDELVKRNEGGY